MKIGSQRAAAVVAALSVLLVACGGKDTPKAAQTAASATSKSPTASATRALPSPVSIAGAPVGGFTLADPAFEPIPGAKADFGHLGGTAYQIEIPDNWNGRLVMYMHGNDQDAQLHVYPPIQRADLIHNGFAWASSSYSVNIVYVSGVAADETAALWDFFAQKYGRPAHSYVMGVSMGGAATVTSAERYGDRYDGALALCGDAPPLDYQGDFVVMAAYAAGVTQSEFDSTDLSELINKRIRPALVDPATRTRFENLFIDRTGGPRPLAREGIRAGEEQAWEVYPGNIGSGFYNNAKKIYKLGPTAGVTSDEFNRNVLRVNNPPPNDPYGAGNVVTGKLQMPLITMQGTGDIATVFSGSQEVRRRVDAAGKSDLLVQRAIQSPIHCAEQSGFTTEELKKGLDDLVAWAEQGTKPDGEDLLGDLSAIGHAFTSTPRLGSAAAAALPGDGQHMTLRGTLTFDGQRVVPDGNIFVWAEVRTAAGMLRACSYEPVTFLDDGRYELSVAADAEVSGCGSTTARAYLLFFKDGVRHVSTQPIPWADGAEATFDAAFVSAQTGGAGAATSQEFFGTEVYGSLSDAKGNSAKPGTFVEAYVGDTLCGRFVASPVVMVFDAPGVYDMRVAAPAAIPACASGETITFRVNGVVVPGNVTHDLSRNGHALDLATP